MLHENDLSEDDDVVRKLQALERTAPLTPGEVDRIAALLRRDGLLRPRRRVAWWIAGAAAAGLIFALGVFTGSVRARHGTLDEMLQRNDLTLSERVLLLQRAGSAYVKAAQSYADATTRVDSSAVEVASRVLLGAASAIARNSLDAGVSARLTNALVPAPVVKPIIWF